VSAADEFEALAFADHENPGQQAARRHQRNAWIDEHRDLILRALQHEEAQENADNGFGRIYYEYEKGKVVFELALLYQGKGEPLAMDRGFKEGWRAFRNYIIQARDAQKETLRKEEAT
jgi:hypothetical protein